MNQRILVIIPAFNEEKTISQVLLGLRAAAPAFDRIVVTDGSRDTTSRIVDEMGERQLKLPCNLGYGLALQTGMKYALQQGYDVVVTIDSDGQHDPADVPLLVGSLLDSGADVVIGSRYCHSRSYSGPLGRRVGQMLFSRLTRLFVGRRVYDTTSGFKALRAQACEVITGATFMDFHIEAIVRLSLLGYHVAEHPVTVKERVYGVSMHSFTNALQYPLKTSLLTLVATADVLLARRKR